MRLLRVMALRRLLPARSVTTWLLPIALVLLSSGCGDNPVDGGEEGPVAVDPQVMNERLGRGVNFGNALEAPSEGDWGIVLQALHFERAVEAGFRTIRLPVRWSTHTDPNPPYTIDESFFDRVDWAIDQALLRGLHVILNVHHYEEMAVDPEAHKSRWIAMWRQIAQRYRDFSEDLLFELLNEPHEALTSDTWNVFLRDALQVVRETNPTRNVVVGPASWNNPSALRELILPQDDHIIVTVHFYEPFAFTHQGAEWVSGADDWLGTAWTGTDEQKSFITNILLQAADWGTDNGRPIFVGEFGAYSRADLISRSRWTGFVARECERLGFSWAYWEFMSGFGLYDPDDDSWTPELRYALVPPGG
jgi:endoglucanase